MNAEPITELPASPPLSSSDSLGRLTWTHRALNAGGTVMLYQVLKGKSIFRARMHWDGERDVVGKISMDPQGALRNLEAALAEDCANEMFKSGGA